LRQAFEESLHNATVSVCCSAYNLSKEEVSSAYKNVPTIKAKDDFIMQHTTDLNRPDFDIKTLAGKKEFVTNLFAFYIVCEGIFFYSGFAMALALGRQNKVTGLGDQIRYTLRDESLHIEFGVYLINRILSEYPEIRTKEFEAELVELLKKAVDLEIAYAKDALPNGILGLNADMFIDYMQYVGNRRLESLGLEFRFDSDKNPFPWLGESMDVTAMGAFFERRERNYKQASTLEDDL
jgi:ribonucleoside-diphosphate reductase beta chain